VFGVLSKLGVAPAAPFVVVHWFPRLRPYMIPAVVAAGIFLIWVVVDNGSYFRQYAPAAVVTRGAWREIWDYLGGAGNVDRDWIVGSAYALFTAIAALLLWRLPLETPRQLVAAVAMVLFFFVFVGYAGYRPWYQIWFLPFVMIAGVRWLIAATLVFNAGAFLIVLAANWRADITRDMELSDPIGKASVVTWLAVGATAAIFYFVDRDRVTGETSAASRRQRPRAQPRRKPLRSR